MTRKHFRALAERISHIETAQGRAIAAMAVADVCEEFNRSFDRRKFMDACKIQIKLN